MTFILIPTVPTLDYKAPNDLVLLHLLSRIPLVTLLRSHRLSFCSTNTPHSVQPPGLCADCWPSAWTAFHSSPSERGIPRALQLKSPHPLPRRCWFRTFPDILREQRACQSRSCISRTQTLRYYLRRKSGCTGRYVWGLSVWHGGLGSCVLRGWRGERGCMVGVRGCERM